MPSALTEPLPAAMWLPTSATRRAGRQRIDPASSLCSSSGYDASGVPDSRCHSASIEWVLPPPKLVCRFTTGDAFRSPPIRRAAQVSRSFSPSVRYVRRKNSTGSTYSRDSFALRHVVQVGGELRAAQVPVAHVLRAA